MSIRTCLKFNPSLRPTAESLLRHPYCAEFHNEEEELVFPGGPIGLIVDDNVKLTAQQYRDQLYQEISNRRRDARRKDGTTPTAGSSSVPGVSATTTPVAGEHH